MLTRQQREHGVILPLQTAIYHAVHDIRGGVGAIAGAYGYNARTLQNKVNLGCDTHLLNIKEFEAILAYTRDPRLMDSLCSTYGGAIWIDISGVDSESSSSMFGQIGEIATNVGQLTRNVAAALEDGRVTEDELALLEKSVLSLTQSAHGVIALAKSMMEAGAVRHG